VSRTGFDAGESPGIDGNLHMVGRNGKIRFLSTDLKVGHLNMKRASTGR
jgi:hypothetical protein